MSTEVETGLGSEFWLANASGTLVLLGEVTNIPIPNGTTGLIDASHYKTVGFKDYIAAPLADGEEADLEMNWVPGSATDLLCQEAKNKTREFRIVLPVDGEQYEFTGSVLVRDYNRTNPREDKRTGSLRVKWVGDIDEGMVA
ncbi:hypothetical protein [Sphingomonas sp.]|uniref:hypothetical protein n=1 Tax=Sphingomonas sp. TaxID=28214 RepID=UPI003B3B51AB